MKCPQCGAKTRQIIPNVASDVKEKHYCRKCQQYFYAVLSGTGTTINPDRYLVRKV
jgi:hypothetical protein